MWGYTILLEEDEVVVVVVVVSVQFYSCAACQMEVCTSCSLFPRTFIRPLHLACKCVLRIPFPPPPGMDRLTWMSGGGVCGGGGWIQSMDSNDNNNLIVSDRQERYYANQCHSHCLSNHPFIHP